MKRTIFEVPVSLQEHLLCRLNDHNFSYTYQNIVHRGLTEVSVTHDKKQDYILDTIDLEIEQMAMQEHVQA